jgi:hypothetical protein
MDRFSKLRDLVEQALDELSHPTALSPRHYTLLATLHEISLEIARLRSERRRRQSAPRRTAGEPRS